MTGRGGFPSGLSGGQEGPPAGRRPVSREVRTVTGRSVRGFTLLELLVVVAIIALLVAMVLPVWKPLAALIQRARCQAQLRGLGSAYLLYVNQSGRFPPLWSLIEYDFTSHQYASWYYPQHDYRACVYGRFDASFGPLVWHHVLTNSDTFVCPTVKDAEFPWWHDTALPRPPGWSDEAPLEDTGTFWSCLFPNYDPIRLREDLAAGRISTSAAHSRTCYSIRPYLYPWTRGQVEARGVRALMADNFNVPVTVLERHGDGVNVFFLDGTVQYVQHPLLWDNELTWNYVANTPTVNRIWKALDEWR